jgi:hypothetical protein
LSVCVGYVAIKQLIAYVDDFNRNSIQGHKIVLIVKQHSVFAETVFFEQHFQ